MDSVSNGSTNRIHALDAIRGLAALAVLFSHCISPLPVFTKWGFPSGLVAGGEGDSASVHALKWALTSRATSLVVQDGEG